MSFIRNLRGVLLQSFAALPLILIGFSFFMGVTQGNVGLLVLVLGQLTTVPLSILTSNTILEFLNKRFAFIFGDNTQYFSVANKDLCNLVPGATDYTIPNVWVAPSYWFGQVAFFFAFLFSNAYYTYNMEASPDADAEKLKRRKNQIMISTIVTSIVFLGLIIARKTFTDCERWAGLGIGSLLMGFLGYSWYLVARRCSMRDSDIFGIVQKVLPAAAMDPPPMTCVYTGGK